jgi:hypothetical protein
MEWPFGYSFSPEVQIEHRTGAFLIDSGELLREQEQDEGRGNGDKATAIKEWQI